VQLGPKLPSQIGCQFTHANNLWSESYYKNIKTLEFLYPLKYVHCFSKIHPFEMTMHYGHHMLFYAIMPAIHYLYAMECPKGLHSDI
jgi:hypothetical protein